MLDFNIQYDIEDKECCVYAYDGFDFITEEQDNEYEVDGEFFGLE